MFTQCTSNLTVRLRPTVVRNSIYMKKKHFYMAIFVVIREYLDLCMSEKNLT